VTLLWASRLLSFLMGAVTESIQSEAGVPMCGSFLEFEHVFPAALLCLVVVTCSAGAQPVPPAMWSSSQLPDAPSSLVRVARSEPRSQKDRTVFASASTLRLIADEVGPTSWMSSSGKGMQNHLALNEHAPHYTSTGIAGGSLTWLPSYSRVQPKTLHSDDDWQYYGHRIPLVGPVVLRLSKQAQAHPHVASVFKVVQPQF